MNNVTTSKEKLIILIARISEEMADSILTRIMERWQTSLANEQVHVYNSAEWDESKHPRQKDGRFGTGVTSTKWKPSEKPLKPIKTGDKDFDNQYNRLVYSVSAERTSRRKDAQAMTKDYLRESRKLKREHDRLSKKLERLESEVEAMQEKYADRGSGSLENLRFPTKQDEMRYTKTIEARDKIEKAMDQIEDAEFDLREGLRDRIRSLKMEGLPEESEEYIKRSHDAASGKELARIENQIDAIEEKYGDREGGSNELIWPKDPNEAAEEKRRYETLLERRKELMR